jgi:hypothetical protein
LARQLRSGVTGVGSWTQLWTSGESGRAACRAPAPCGAWCMWLYGGRAPLRSLEQSRARVCRAAPAACESAAMLRRWRAGGAAWGWPPRAIRAASRAALWGRGCDIGRGPGLHRVRLRRKTRPRGTKPGALSSGRCNRPAQTRGSLTRLRPGPLGVDIALPSISAARLPACWGQITPLHATPSPAHGS